ncbi:MAG: response regulator [Bryobacteraceae bacterium]|nr:response regulator [Bryobacteraceae bacterium]
MRTLIADDDVVSRRVLEQFLTGYGPPDIAANGKEAVDAVVAAIDAGTPYELICLDMVMPGMSGHAALKRIRDIEREQGFDGGQAAKIVMTTSLGRRENVIAAFQAKCDAYLVKPIVKAHLLEHLRRLGLID